jgi:NADPH-dependent 2,4-dienoyl-CoA reductase/sulfur reductase-like enzyme
MSREQILEACQELLEEGKSVTVRAVVDKVGGSSRDVSPVVKEFKNNLEKESLVPVTREADVEVSTANGEQDNHRDVEPVGANLDRVDRDAQLSAAREVIATAYYKKTKLFTLPGLQEEVNQALTEIDEYATVKDETLSPKGMLQWLKAKQLQH